MLNNPFNNNYKGTGMPKPRSKKDFKWFVFCIIAAVLCLICSMWLFAIVMIFCGVAYFMLYKKHKAGEEKVEDIIDKLDDEEDDDDESENSFFHRKKTKIITKKQQEKRKQEYDKFLVSLDEELGDFDTEELYNEDYED